MVHDIRYNGFLRLCRADGEVFYSNFYLEKKNYVSLVQVDNIELEIYVSDA